MDWLKNFFIKDVGDERVPHFYLPVYRNNYEGVRYCMPFVIAPLFLFGYAFWLAYREGYRSVLEVVGDWEKGRHGRRR